MCIYIYYVYVCVYMCMLVFILYVHTYIYTLGVYALHTLYVRTYLQSGCVDTYMCTHILCICA